MKTMLIIEEIKYNKKVRARKKRQRLFMFAVLLITVAGAVIGMGRNTDHSKLAKMETKTGYISNSEYVWNYVESLNLGVDVREAINYICEINGVERADQLLNKEIKVPVAL